MFGGSTFGGAQFGGVNGVNYHCFANDAPQTSESISRLFVGARVVIESPLLSEIVTQTNPHQVSVSGEISFRYTSGLILYAQRINRWNQVIIVSNNVAEFPVDPNWYQYTIPLTEQGSTGYYVGTAKNIFDSGDYVIIFRQAGAKPQTSDLNVGLIKADEFYG